jgi:endonuclease/exonuclease/phosphatase family metal-dependent hydrolase
VFRVMTWNVENLFRPGAAAGPSTPDAYQTKLAALAAVIIAQDPDVVSLQEIGDPDALNDLIDAIGGAWGRRVSAHPDARGIRVAWLAKPAITASVELVDFPAQSPAVTVDDSGTSLDAMGRGALAITVAPPDGAPVQLISTHLKSKLLTFPGGRFQPHDKDERARYATYALDRRAAEAATLRSWTTSTLTDAAGARLILTGDLNDTPQAATTQILLGPPGSEIDTPGFHRRDQGDTRRLWNLAPLMPLGKGYSRVDQGRANSSTTSSSPPPWSTCSTRSRSKPSPTQPCPRSVPTPTSAATPPAPTTHPSSPPSPPSSPAKGTRRA